MDFARARHLMVETQVRTADVVDPELLATLRALPRETFTPAAQRALAYADSELPLGPPGRYMLRPREIGKLIQEVRPRAGERALEIAGGLGYGAAVLARLVKDVVLLEPDQDLAFGARAALDGVGLGKVKIVSTAIVDGWRDEAPYDLIILNGAAERVPQSWLEQLAEGGRLGVIVRKGPAGEARIYTKAGGVCAYRAVFDAAPPALPALVEPQRFVF